MANTSSTTKDGAQGARPDREAHANVPQFGDRPARPAKGEPEFGSYYGRPVLNAIPWEARDIAGYLFTGGLAGASSVLAAGADLSGRPALARPLKVGALGAVTVSLGALVHDLGRPSRFLNMLRTFKVTSPMSVGTWILTVYGPLTALAAASDVTGLAPRVGRASTLGAAAVAPLVATYTAALIADTAVPVWHDGHRELPYVFAASAASAAAGLGLIGAPVAQAGPARRLAVAGVAAELAASRALERRTGPLVGEVLHQDQAGRLLKLSKALGTAGALGAVASAVVPGMSGRGLAAAAGAGLLAASACTRFGLFAAGQASVADPKYTVVPQRERRDARV